MKKMIGAFMLFSALNLMAQVPSAEAILIKLDENMTSDNKIIHSKMTIHGRRSSRTMEAKSWIEGTKRSFTHFLAPAREQGTKMLKLEDQLWTYSPSTDRIIKISGHMLRQSVMGSDLSYEDMMEDPILHSAYLAKNVGEEIINSRSCWVLDLQAAKNDIAYSARKIWVDKERYLPLKEERYAKSGKLLKKMEIKEIARMNQRWIAKRAVFLDELKGGLGTEFEIISVEFDADIPEFTFSKAALKK